MTHIPLKREQRAAFMEDLGFVVEPYGTGHIVAEEHAPGHEATRCASRAEVVLWNALVEANAVLLRSALSQPDTERGEAVATPLSVDRINCMSKMLWKNPDAEELAGDVRLARMVENAHGIRQTATPPSSGEPAILREITEHFAGLSPDQQMEALAEVAEHPVAKAIDATPAAPTPSAVGGLTDREVDDELAHAMDDIAAEYGTTYHQVRTDIMVHAKLRRRYAQRIQSALLAKIGGGK